MNPSSQTAQDATSAITASLVAEPTGAQIDAAVSTLRSLAEGAFAGDDAARAALQPLLYRLHYGEDEATYAYRQWLASRIYPIEEHHVAAPDWPAPLASDDFIAYLSDQQRRLSPLAHPLFQYLSSESATFSAYKIYLTHKWIIMLTFWRALAELGQRLQRVDLDGAAVLYENVHEELGAGDPGEAHLRQHYRQLRHIGIPATWDMVPRYPETFEYINFRLHCMRHAETGWGLGSAYSQEATSLEYTMGHFHSLRRFGVAREHCEVYYRHEDIDTEHTDELATLIGRSLTTASSQRACARAQRHQMTLWLRHFDRVLEDIRRVSY